MFKKVMATMLLNSADIDKLVFREISQSELFYSLLSHEDNLLKLNPFIKYSHVDSYQFDTILYEFRVMYGKTVLLDFKDFSEEKQSNLIEFVEPLRQSRLDKFKEAGLNIMPIDTLKKGGHKVSKTTKGKNIRRDRALVQNL